MTNSHEAAPLLTQSPLSDPSPQLGRWLLLITALLQLLSPSIFQFQGSKDDPPIVPPGPFFSIWGLVTTGCAAIAVWGIAPGRASALPYRHIQLPLSLVQVLFICWLAAATSPRCYALTLPIFAGMLTGLGISLRAVLEAPAGTDGVTRGLLGVVLGIYAGWSTAAIWLNAATLLPSRMLEGDSGVVVQVAVVGGAVLSAAIGSYVLRGNLAYALAASWALVGITISAADANLVPVAVTSGLGLLVVGSVVVFRRLGAWVE